MSQNKLISVKNVVINLLDDLALTHSKYTDMFTRWALWAEKQIASRYSYILKHEVLDIKGCVAELPEDAVWLQIAVLGDQGDCCTNLFERICGNINASGSFASSDSVNSFLIVDVDASTDNVNFGVVNYIIQDNKILFSQNYDGQKVTIQYLGLKTDCDGIPYVNENHIEALTEYCMYKFRSRNPKSGIDIGLYRDHKQNWHRLAASAKADDVMPSYAENEAISQMINNPWAGKGLYLGQYTTEGGYLGL